MKRSTGVACLLGVLNLMVSCTLNAESIPQGDAERGRMAFAKCRTCHYPEKVVGHNNGPSLWNIFGKKAGKQPGFEYSEVFRKADFIWTPELLYFWLKNPDTFMPDSQMVFVVPETDQERADIIAYLQTFQEQ